METGLMGMNLKITCDGCGADITTRTNSVDYRLVLESESKPGYGGGAYTDMMKYPPVKRPFYFCDLLCLDHWRDREHHKTSLWRTWWQKWKDEHGTKSADGRVSSYPVPPRETTEPLDTKFEAAALTAFPLTHAGS
jgi:hypothetical protein